MRFIHIADVHLGVEPDKGKKWSGERKEEIWKSFASVVERAEREKVDLLLIAGDLFHRQPLVRELKEVDYLFSRLTQTKVVLIAGNHDYIGQNSAYRSFPWSEQVSFLYNPHLDSVYFPELNVQVYGMSYHSREMGLTLLEEAKPDKIEPYDAAPDRMDVNKVKPNESKSDSGSNKRIHILVGHGGDATHLPFNKQIIAKSGFDYIALGHIHKPEILVRNKMAYAGALEPIDCNDMGTHGYIMGDIEDGQVDIQFISSALRSYLDLEIDMNEKDTLFSLKEYISRDIQKNGEKNIYKITIRGFRDPDIVPDVKTFYSLGNIAEVIDATEPAYDFEKIKRLHKNSIIEKYIQHFENKNDSSELEKKALYYGVQALLEADRG